MPTLIFIGRKISAQNIFENINVNTVSMQSVLLKHQGKPKKMCMPGTRTNKNWETLPIKTLSLSDCKANIIQLLMFTKDKSN